MNAEVLDFSMDNENKNLALEGAISQIEKNFGKGSVMKLGENDQNIDIQSISTGSLGLDIALGIGGFPKGRIIEIYGPESSGKTTLALHAIAEAQTQKMINETKAMKERNDARDEYHRNRPKGMQFGAPLPPEQVQHFRDQIGYTGLADWQK